MKQSQHAKLFLETHGYDMGFAKRDLIRQNKMRRAEQNWKARAFHDRAHLAAMELHYEHAMRTGSIDVMERFRQATEMGRLAANIAAGSHGMKYSEYHLGGVF